MKLTINEIFNYKSGNYALTEEVIYQQKPTSQKDSIPIFSGSDNNTKPIGYIDRDSKNKKGKDVKIFEGPCIILTKDGSAGLMTFRSKEQGEFTINHHACVLKIKNKWKGKIDTQWFALQYNDKLYRYATSKSDNRVLSTKWFDRVKFEVPDYSLQIEQREKRVKLIKAKEFLNDFIDGIDKLLYKTKLPMEGKSHTINDIFKFLSGNYGLTEEFIYHNLPTNEQDKIPIYSGATKEENHLGYISRMAKPRDQRLKIYNGPSILVSRKGYAGEMRVIYDSEFSINDDAYVMKPREEWTNEIDLRWFVFQFQDLFLNIVTSKSDNSTFNKTYAGKQIVTIPNIDIQNKVANKLKELSKKERKVKTLLREINYLLYSEIHNIN